MGLVLLRGTVDLGETCGAGRGCARVPCRAWGIVTTSPSAALLFLIRRHRRNKRIPFDLPEASGADRGYYTEYSAMKMTLHVRQSHRVAIVGALFTTLFLGGYNLPYMSDSGFAFPAGLTWALPHAAVVVIQLGVFLAKVLLVCSFQILVRWSLPRFRYDQLLAFAWKFMFPLALANLTATAVVLWLMERA